DILRGVSLFNLIETAGVKNTQFIAAIAFALAALAPRYAVAADDEPYKVADGNKVDKMTLEGWRTWRALACERCHGARQDGRGGVQRHRHARRQPRRRRFERLEFHRH